jgi:5'-phosphate synthase pdxT subunit
MTIGILAIQGSVIEHKHMLQKLDVDVQEVRLPEDMDGIDGIIIPGGESTTISKLLKRFGLFEVLRERIADGLPVWGTCAGAILLAKKITGLNPPPTLETMDIEVDRNAYGRQLESFETKIQSPKSHVACRHNGTCKIQNFNGIFIRAPKIKPLSANVEILAECNEVPVMLKQGNMLVTSFHPELTEDVVIHEYFLGMCK